MYLKREENSIKIAIIGSRTLVVPNIEEYLLEVVTEIVSGGAKYTIDLFRALGKPITVVV